MLDFRFIKMVVCDTIIISCFKLNWRSFILYFEHTDEYIGHIMIGLNIKFNFKFNMRFGCTFSLNRLYSFNQLSNTHYNV